MAKHGSREELWAARMSLHATLDMYTWIRHSWENRDSPRISRNRVFCNTLSNNRNRNLSLEADLMDNGSSLRNVQGWWSSFLLAPSTAKIITTLVKFLFLSFLPQPATTSPSTLCVPCLVVSAYSASTPLWSLLIYIFSCHSVPFLPSLCWSGLPLPFSGT